MSLRNEVKLLRPMSLLLPEMLWIFRFIFERYFSYLITELIFDVHFEEETPKALKTRLIDHFTVICLLTQRGWS